MLHVSQSQQQTLTICPSEFCFTGGYIEVGESGMRYHLGRAIKFADRNICTAVSLPGSTDISGCDARACKLRGFAY